MSRKASPTTIGAFVLGGAALFIVGLAVFGSGRLFSQSETFVLFFDGSLNGLNVGAPVHFRGVKVGEVTEVTVRYHVREQRVDIPVYVRLQRNRIHEIGENLDREANLIIMVEHGLRARLAMQSFVTGLLAVELDFHPNAPPKFVGGDMRFAEIPTIPSTLDELARTLQDIPFKELVEDLRRTVNTVDAFLDSDELRGTIGHISETARAAGSLVRNLDEQVNPVAAQLQETLAQAQKTLKTADEKIALVEAAFGDTLRDVRALAQSLDEKDDSLILGIQETAASAGLALEQARLTLLTVNEVFARDSDVRYRLAAMLEEVAKAARAVRALADYLERYPESLIHGKAGGAMP